MKIFIPALLASVLVLGAPRGAAAQDFRVTLDDVQFHNPAIRIGQGLELKENETVRGALVIGGDATIAGRVDEDVVVILGKVNLASTAVIEGSLVVIGGTAVTADGARVHRDLFVVGGHEGGASFAPGGSHVVIGTAGMGAWFAGIVPWLTHGLLLGRPIVPSLPWVWGIAGIFFLVNLLFNVLFDNPIRAVTTTLRATPLTTFMTGLLVMLLFGPVCFLLAVSLIGIAVIPVLLCALLAPAAAHARPVYGMGDQNPTSYQDKRMHGLKKLKTARYAVAWDWYKDPTQNALLSWWMGEVKAAHLNPLISFNRNWHGSSGRKKIPSLTQYKRGFKLFGRKAG